MTSTRGLVCPKCSGRMGSYERSGIVLDQCEDCRGMFLDQGELERMVDTEGGGWSGMVSEPADRHRSGSKGPRQDSRDDVPERVGDPDRRPETTQRSTRREGRLGGLFDLLGGE